MPGNLEAAWQKATSSANGDDAEVSALAEDAQLPVPVDDESVAAGQPADENILRLQ
jgi:hypothetical protein